MCLVIPSVAQSFHLLHTGLDSISLVQFGIQNGSPLNNIIDSDHHEGPRLHTHYLKKLWRSNRAPLYIE